MQSQMYVPPLSKANKILIGAYVVIFLLTTILESAAGVSLLGILGLSFQGLKTGLVFQILTYPFVDNSLMSVVFNGLIMWFIGSELEQKWGSKFYLKFLAITAYSCGAIYLLLSMGFGSSLGAKSLYGLAGVNMALLVAYAIIYSERTMIFMFIFPMKARYFCMLLVAMEIFMAVTANAFNAAWAHVISMATGFIYLKYQSMRARGTGPTSVMEEYRNYQANKRRSNLRLVKNEEEKPNPEDPKYWQ